MTTFDGSDFPHADFFPGTVTTLLSCFSYGPVGSFVGPEDGPAVGSPVGSLVGPDVGPCDASGEGFFVGPPE